MSRSLAERRRAKLSVTVDPELLGAVDAFVAAHPGLDRSKVMDQALALWYAREQERAMEEQFGGTPDVATRAEHEAWQRIQRAAARRVFRPR
ncbi:MAG TPA: hypothetical protein VFE37_14020 [Chloroflexota bacterium]|nr:hypothetical protein [Chloroflexota bacterium]